VIVLVDHEEEDTLFAAITSGAAAYLPQSVEVDDLRDALRRVAGGAALINERGRTPSVMAAPAGASAPWHMTSRRRSSPSHEF